MARTGNLQGMALPFFTEVEWLRAKAAMDDRDTFHDTYAEFKARVEQVEGQLRRQGQATVRIHIRVDELTAWCAARGRKVDAHARSEYAALKAMENDNNGRRR